MLDMNHAEREEPPRTRPLIPRTAEISSSEMTPLKVLEVKDAGNSSTTVSVVGT